jgi:hypothetical protein
LPGRKIEPDFELIIRAIMKKIYAEKLKPKTVDILRDTALKIEKDDLETAYELMLLAYASRPNGPYIKNKIEEYSRYLFRLKPDQKKLYEFIRSGEVAIVPIGFRCYTKQKFIEKTGINQQTLVFDNGFFPPDSIASVLKEPKIDLNYENDSHAVCMKYEGYHDPAFGKGIKFQTSSYDEINSFVKSKNMKDLNRYIDSTFGYYTLDKKHNFVLAHYNWHKFADPKRSNGITDPKINLQRINDTLNRRIERMFNTCNKAEHIFFIHMENQGLNYMMIDDKRFNLHDFQNILSIAHGIFKAKVDIVDLSKINNAQEIIDMI